MKFVSYRYDSIYEMEPHEIYGMGRESLTHIPPAQELEYFLDMGLKNLAKNSSIEKRHIKNMSFYIEEITEDNFKSLVDRGLAIKVCDSGQPCSIYGCTKPEEHELHWIILSYPLNERCSLK